MVSGSQRTADLRQRSIREYRLVGADLDDGVLCLVVIELGERCLTFVEVFVLLALGPSSHGAIANDQLRSWTARHVLDSVCALAMTFGRGDLRVCSPGSWIGDQE